MYAYINPDDNQVMAIYSHETGSEVWSSKGYEKYPVDPSIEGDITRDYQATVEDGAIVSLTENTNPIQPDTSISEKDAIRKLAETRKSIGRIEQEISEGHIPDRTTNQNVDEVMTDLETELAELRSQIG